MEAVILCGIQATGKSSFCRERLFNSHVRINLDMLKTRVREDALIAACLEAKQAFVVDNTNPTREERAKYIAAARARKFRVVGYYFESRIADAVLRNAGREGKTRIPESGIAATSNRLEHPSLEEGFDALYFVRLIEGGFHVEEWRA